MTNTKNISLPNTVAALAELSQALLNLENMVDAKSSELKKSSADSLTQLEKCKKEKLQLILN